MWVARKINTQNKNIFDKLHSLVFNKINFIFKSMTITIPSTETEQEKFFIDPVEYTRLKEMLTIETLDLLNAFTDNLKVDKEFRPTVNLDIILDGMRLLYRHADSEYLSMYGGGIDNDDILTAILREIHEELGLTADKIESIKFIGKNSIENRPGKAPRDGFSKGKYYFVFEVKLKDTVKLEDLTSEENVAEIVQLDRSIESLSRLSAEKANLVLDMLKPKQQ